MTPPRLFESQSVPALSPDSISPDRDTYMHIAMVSFVEAGVSSVWPIPRGTHSARLVGPAILRVCVVATLVLTS